MHDLTKRLIKERLAVHEGVLGFNPVNVEQQSSDWHKMRLGVVTASMVSKVLMGKTSAGRLTYMAQLAAEVATGVPKDIGSFKQMQWGNENEPKAIQTYQFETGQLVDRVPFLYSDDMRCGISPDGITGKKGIEIKCPYTSEVHLLTLCEDVIKKEYKWQTNFSMWVSGVDEWDFCSFDPRMRKNMLSRKTVSLSDLDRKTLDDAVPQFISELDKMIVAAGFQWGEQWGD